MKRFIIGLVLVSACESPQLQSPAPRLSAIGYRAESGATVQTGIHDKVLGPCTWMSIGGELACVPDGDGDVYYLDEACTQPVAIAKRPGTIPTLAWTGDWASYDCDANVAVHAETHLWRVSEALSPASFLYYENGAGCARMDGAGVSIFTLGDERTGEMVHGQVLDEDAGDGLTVRSVVADDGTTWRLNVIHETWGPCTLDMININGGSCYPAAYALLWGAVHESAAPEQRLALRPQDGCKVRAVWAGAQPGTPPRQYFAIGQAVPREDVCWEKSESMTCGPPPTAYDFYRVGDVIAPEAFAPVTLEKPSADGLTVGQMFSRSGVLLARVRHFFDPASDRWCAPLAVWNEVLCVGDSDAKLTSSYYADAGCTTPLAAGDSGLERFLVTTKAGGEPIVRALTPADKVFTLDPASHACSPAVSPPQNLFAVGADVTAELPRLTPFDDGASD